MDFEFKFKIINFNLETNMSKMLFFNIWSKSLFFYQYFTNMLNIDLYPQPVVKKRLKFVIVHIKEKPF